MVSSKKKYSIGQNFLNKSVFRGGPLPFRLQGFLCTRPFKIPESPAE